MPQRNPSRRKNPPANKPSESGRDGAGGLPAPVETTVPDEFLRNVPPQSTEAEQAVLGGVFLKPDSFFILVDMLREEDFYFPAHRILFSAFRDLFQKGVPIDFLTVSEHLKSQSRMEEAGGAAYLVDLSRGIISAANAEFYAGIVLEKSMLRHLISSCADIIGQCYDPGREVKELLNDSEQAIFAISQRSSASAYQDAGALTRRLFDELENRSRRGDVITGVPTGYPRLDQLTTGLQPSDLIILAARPSVGKTAFALNIAMRAAIRSRVSVAVYSLEMSMQQVISRMLCAWGKVDVSRLRRGFLSDEDWQGLYAAGEVFRDAPLYVDDTPALTPLELRARARRLKNEKGLGLIIVDYLQLMRPSRRLDSRELEVSDITRNLKAMAKELNVPVLALSQLNRKVEERGDKRPMLSDLRESGAIEQDADLILFIAREAAYMKASERPPVDRAEIIIGKQRNGPVGAVELVYASACTAFEDPEYTDRPEVF
jgi:replicative DNA helicase